MASMRSPTVLLAGLLALVAALVSLFTWSGGGSVASESEPTDEPVVTVSVAPIVRATFHDIVTGWGHVEPEPAMAGRLPASAQVASPVAGLLAEVLAGEGDRVARGAPLFRLDSRVSDVGVARAREAVRFAEQQLARQEQLGPGAATSRQAYEEALQQVQAARNALALAEREQSLLTIVAPIDGTIVRLNARPGDAVEPARVLAEVVDLHRLVVSAAIKNADVARVRPGQPVELISDPETMPRLPRAATVSGTVVFVGSQVDRATDTVVVRAAVPPSSLLRPGQLVTARIHVETRRNRLAIPVDSVLPDPGGPTIAVVDGDMAVKRRVTVGVREGGLREIEGDGLREGLLVAVDGAFDLGPRTRVRVTKGPQP